MFKRLVFVLGLVFTVAGPTLVMQSAQAELRLPSYAQSADINARTEGVGRRITNYIAGVVAIICILGLFIGAGYSGAGKSEMAMRFYLGSITGLVVAALAYGIAALVAG